MLYITASTNIPDINFRQGLAGKCIIELLQQAAKDKECMAIFTKQKETNNSFYQQMLEAKCITVGVVFNAGRVSLSKTEAFDAVKEKFKEKSMEIMRKSVMNWKFSIKERRRHKILCTN